MALGYAFAHAQQVVIDTLPGLFLIDGDELGADCRTVFRG
jgi:hypothetical protein